MKRQNLGAMTTGRIKIQLYDTSSHFIGALKNFLSSHTSCNIKRILTHLSQSFRHLRTVLQIKSHLCSKMEQIARFVMNRHNGAWAIGELHKPHGIIMHHWSQLDATLLHIILPAVW